MLLKNVMGFGKHLEARPHIINAVKMKHKSHFIDRSNVHIQAARLLRMRHGKSWGREKEKYISNMITT